MQREAEKQSKVSGCAYAVGARQRWAPGLAAGLRHSVWSLRAEGGQSCEYLFADWSDLVRAHWPKSLGSVVRQGLQTYVRVAGIRSTLKPVRQETPYTLWALAYPLVYMLLCMVLALLFVWGGLQAFDGVAGMVAGCAAGAAVLWAGYRLDRLLHVSWLLRILNFARQFSDAPVPALSERFDKTAALIAEQLRDKAYQEVVVVGFSVGSAMAISLVQALRQKMLQQGLGAQPLHFLTLGNCIPLFALMPDAQALRSALLALAQDEKVQWVDISSPSDSASFGMCNLLRLSLPDLQSAEQKLCVNPRHMCTPRFHKLFHATTYRWLRRNKMRMHFQYLMAAELDGQYNYFALLTCKGSWMEFILRRLVR